MSEAHGLPDLHFPKCQNQNGKKCLMKHCFTLTKCQSVSTFESEVRNSLSELELGLVEVESVSRIESKRLCIAEKAEKSRFESISFSKSR